MFVTTIGCTVETDAITIFTEGVAERALESAITVRTCFQAKIAGKLLRDGTTDDVNRAVQGVRAIHDAARSADHFDASCLFAVCLKNLVYITESCSSQGNTIKRHLECAATAGTTKHR